MENAFEGTSAQACSIPTRWFHHAQEEAVHRHEDVKDRTIPSICSHRDYLFEKHLEDHLMEEEMAAIQEVFKALLLWAWMKILRCQQGLATRPDSSGDSHGYGSRGHKHVSMSINKWAKPIQKLELPPRVHLQKASKIKQTWEVWSGLSPV